MAKLSYEKAKKLYDAHGTHRKAAKAGKVALGKLQRALREAPVAEFQGRVEVRGTKVLASNGQKFILTSAQNDTHVHQPTWRALQHLSRYYGAEILVSRFAYRNYQSEDKAAWGQGVRRPTGNRLQWAPELDAFICDERVQLADNLIWCGEFNVSPTSRHPLSLLEPFRGSDSLVIPHPRVAMRAEPSVSFKGPKLLHTTGCVTLRNYIQRKAGLTAEFHHSYGATLAEVDAEGQWWVRQLNATEDGVIHDLDLRADPAGVTRGHRPAATYLADLHPEELDPASFEATLDMLKQLRPHQTFIGDVMSVRLSHHNRGNHLARFALRSAGDNDLLAGARMSFACLRALGSTYMGARIPTVCRSNHDDHLVRWVTEEEGYKDPTNARLWHALNLEFMDTIERLGGSEDWHQRINPVETVIKHADVASSKGPIARWLGLDEDVMIHGVNHGAHGHAGPRGSRGNPRTFARLGVKGNYGHVHSPGIWDGAYFAGTHGAHKYYTGPSSSCSANILTHTTGKRQILVTFNGKWRA